MRIKQIFGIIALASLSAIAYGDDVINNQIYNITNIGEEHGLELGDNSYSRGKQSIVTSKNGMAIGKGAVASGDNNNGETIKQKLQENQEKLKEIENKQKEVNRLSNEITLKRAKERETIEAGIRVEEIKKAKAKAYEEYEKLQKAWQEKYDGSKDFFKEHQAKLDDLNSKLTGVGNLQQKDITSPEGLEKAAIEFKTKVENGTSLSLSKEFYKDYIQSYYKALGDLRKNKIKQYYANSHRFEKNTDEISNSIKEQDIKNKYYADDSTDDFYLIRNGYTYQNGFLTMDDYQHMDKRNFQYNKIKPNENLRYYDIEKEIIDENTYNKYKENVPLFKAAFKEYFNGCNDPRLTPEFKEKLYKLNDAKIDIWEKRAEIVYLQGKYEETKNTNFLDKKKKVMDELDKMTENYYETFNSDEYSIYKNNARYHGKWIKENIDDIMEKNKITTDKLTDELEKALGINKNAIQERENLLNKMKEEYEQAKKNADGMNPSEKDLILAREYEKVRQELQELSNDLIVADARLKELKEALTLHDLKNKGENNFALGTNSLAVEDDSYAIGTNSSAIGTQAISIGKQATTIGKKSVTIGNDSLTKGSMSYSIGDTNIVYGEDNLIFGNNNKIGMQTGETSNRNIVIGSNITIQNKIDNAIVLGNNSLAIQNALSIGNSQLQRQIKYVAKGTEDTDAVNKKQLDELGESLNKKITQLEKEKADKTELNKIKLQKGSNGESAFEIWKRINNKPNATEKEFLETLKGEKGKNGLSAYEIWKQQAGNQDKSLEEYFKSLKGEKGEKGKDGLNGSGNSDNLGNGEIKKREKRSVNGDTIYNYLNENYVRKDEVENVKNELRGTINRSTAISIAMGSLNPLSYDPYRKSQIMASLGNFGGESAVAVGLSHYFSENTLLTGSLGLGTNTTKGDTSLAFGLSITKKFGDKKEIEELPGQYQSGQISATYELIKEVEKLKKEIEVLKNSK